MIRKRKLYVRPKKAFEKVRIGEENALMEKYGLKNKIEIWKTKAKVNYFRKRAMVLAKASAEEQEVLFSKLRNIGLDIKATADVLDLDLTNLLERRLPTVIFKKGISKTVKEARQMVVHKRILISGNVNNTPSYIVRVNEENLIKLNQAKQKPVKIVKENPVEEKPVTSVEEPAK